MKRFPFTVYFIELSTLIRVLAFAQAKRKPFSWRDPSMAPIEPAPKAALPIATDALPEPEPSPVAVRVWIAASPVVAHPGSAGPLATSHQAFDDPAHCDDCHVAGSPDVDNAKCLGCHDHQDLTAQIAAKRGLHASNGVVGRACKTCHAEHKGRGFDLMGWKSMRGGERAFDDAPIGWTLPRKYRAWTCVACHPGQNRSGLRVFLGADRSKYP